MKQDKTLQLPTEKQNNATIDNDHRHSLHLTPVSGIHVRMQYCIQTKLIKSTYQTTKTHKTETAAVDSTQTE